MTDLIKLWSAARSALVSAPPAHDITHVQRVTHTASQLGQQVGADLDVLVPAAILHELVNLPKDHPQSSESGQLCAASARTLLIELRWPAERVHAVATCISEHSWSKGRAPSSLEAAVLQDADRLDAIGAIGVARCMATCGEISRALYSPNDPLCRQRTADDTQFGLDHFFRKLLRIEERLNTDAAKRMATPRTAFLRQFITQLASELPDA